MSRGPKDGVVEAVWSILIGRFDADIVGALCPVVGSAGAEATAMWFGSSYDG